MQEKLKLLKNVVDEYMKKVPEVKWYCKRCLETKRWNSNVILMVVDASFTSIGLNYFQTVVPKVEKFRKVFIETRRIKTLDDFSKIKTEELKKVWRNARSWDVVKDVAFFLSKLKKEKNLRDDREAFIYWAKNSKLENWKKEDSIGKIKGVGINTFQYLRMMGGIDTVMPDKIVKRVIFEILRKSDLKLPKDDIDFIKAMDEIAKKTGYKAIELCWMTWLIQSESNVIRMKKYKDILQKI